MYRVQRQFQAVRDAQLVENVVQVILHRLFADEQFLPNLFIAEALRHELHDLFFAVTQQWFLASRPGLCSFGESLHHFGGHAIVEPDFACIYSLNTLNQQVRRRLF
jgi:hypothetical protein